MNGRLSWPIAVVCNLIATSCLLAQGEPITERHEGSSPLHGEESHVVQGEAIYAEFDYVKQKAARLLEDVQVTKKQTFHPGKILLGYSGKKSEHYCSYDPTHKVMGMPAPGWACLVPGKGNRFVGRYLIADGATLGRRKSLSSQPLFEWTEATLPTEKAAELSAGRLFRKEIVYQGAAGNILRLLYREYADDLARPAFSQELTYDLPDEGVLTIAVKGSRLEILEAGNSGIRYKVIRGFEQ